MAPFLFVKKISSGTPIDQFGDGTSSRDYTYISDIVSGILACLDNPNPKPSAVYNLGNSSTVTLNRFIQVVEESVGKKAVKNMKPDQPGDVKTTYADLSVSFKDLGYKPKVSIEEGMARFVQWFTSTTHQERSNPEVQSHHLISSVLRAPVMKGKRVASYASLQDVLMEATPPPSPPLTASEVEEADEMSTTSSDGGDMEGSVVSSDDGISIAVPVTVSAMGAR
jgi:hypothetical protein